MNIIVYMLGWELIGQPSYSLQNLKQIEEDLLVFPCGTDPIQSDSIDTDT